MPRLILSGSIRQQAGGLRAVELSGRTAYELIKALEASHPGLRGWVVDERGALRRHVKMFVRGTEVPIDSTIGAKDELHIVAAISGG